MTSREKFDFEFWIAFGAAILLVLPFIAVLKLIAAREARDDPDKRSTERTDR